MGINRTDITVITLLGDGIRNMCNFAVTRFWCQSGYWDNSSEEASSFNCSACGKRFKYRTSLSHHMKCHTGEATCPQCGKVLSSKANLNRHMPTCSRAKERWTQLKSLGWIKLMIGQFYCWLPSRSFQHWEALRWWKASWTVSEFEQLDTIWDPLLLPSN